MTSGEMDNPARSFLIAVKAEQHPDCEYFDTWVILYSHFQDDKALQKLQKTQPCHDDDRVAVEKGLNRRNS